MCTFGLGGRHLEYKLPIMSDTVESNINGLSGPKNMVFELGISFLSGLQTEINVNKLRH
jgi:hypothetical protein